MSTKKYPYRISKFEGFGIEREREKASEIGRKVRARVWIFALQINLDRKITGLFYLNDHIV